MAKLKKEELLELNSIIQEQGLLELIDKILVENGLGLYSARHIKLVKNDVFKQARPPIKCPKGQSPVEVCTPSGICKWECWPD